MKRLIQKIKLRKFKTDVIKDYFEKHPNENEFYVLYTDGTWENVWYKDDLIAILEKDHVKHIKYIFDATERIIVERDIKINVSEVLNE